MANVIPAESHKICALWAAGEEEAAASLQVRCQPLIEALFREVNPIPVKAALALMGRDSGVLRQPLTEIGPVAANELQKAMTAFGLI